jgi:hypothetical protein
LDYMSLLVDHSSSVGCLFYQPLRVAFPRIAAAVRNARLLGVQRQAPPPERRANILVGLKKPRAVLAGELGGCTRDRSRRRIVLLAMANVSVAALDPVLNIGPRLVALKFADCNRCYARSRECQASRQFALRACFVNHRTRDEDVDAVVQEVLAAAAGVQ